MVKEKEKTLTCLLTKENISMVNQTAKVFSYGPMEINMMVIGDMGYSMVREGKKAKMEQFMMESGEMVYLTVKEI